MKLSVELAPNGGLAVYLPGALYATQLTLGKAEETLITLLRQETRQVEKLLLKARENRTVTFPTEAQIAHWQNHSSRNVLGCPWCKPPPNLSFAAIDAFIPEPKQEKKRKRR